MKFFQVLSLASLALAVPAPSPFNDAPSHVEKRAGALGDAIQAIVSNLTTTVNSDLTAIEQAVGSVGTETVAEIEAVITTSLSNITSALKGATTAIVQATTGGVGGLLGALSGLTQAQLNEIIGALQQTGALLGNVSVAIGNITTTITNPITTAINGEISALQAVLNPFLAPITNLLMALNPVALLKGLSTSGLGQLLPGLVNIITGILHFEL